LEFCIKKGECFIPPLFINGLKIEFILFGKSPLFAFASANPPECGKEGIIPPFVTSATRRGGVKGGQEGFYKSM